MIAWKKIEAKDGIAIGGDVDNSLLIHGDVTIFNLVEATAEAKTLQARAAPRRLDWEHTEARYETYGAFQSGDSVGQVATHAALTDWLRDASAPPVFALLGEYGMGKTLECQRLYCVLRDALMTLKPPAWMPRPIYFDLRKSPHFRDAERRGTMALPGARAMIEQLIDRDWVAFEGARSPSYDDIKAWLAQGALLIVDGLDECLVHLVGGQHSDFLSIWVDLVADAAEHARRHRRRRPRLLVSCRTEFFRNMAEQRALFRIFEHAGDVRTGCLEFILHPLGANQTYGYLRARCPDMHESEVRALIDTTHNLGELSQRPITLKFLAEQLPKLLAMRQRVGTVNAAGLYGLVVEDAFARKDDRRHHLHPEHKRALLSALAAHLWRTGTRTMSHAELRDWLHIWLKTLREYDAKAEYEYRDIRSERLEEDLRTATLVVRTAFPSRTDGAKVDEVEGFGFAHSSFAEYFLAVFLADAVCQNRPDDWAMAIPNVETLDFLAQQLELEQAALLASRRQDGGLSAKLSAWAKLYRPKASELLLKYALHARTAKVASPVLPDLRSADFSGARLRGWRFGERFQNEAAPLLDLSCIRWAGADLREASFAHARLDVGDFSGAWLDMTVLQHCSAQDCDWRDSDLLGTIFRHCRLDGSLWQPLRRCESPKVVACAGASALITAIRSGKKLDENYERDFFNSAAITSFDAAFVKPYPKLRAALDGRYGPVSSLAVSVDGEYAVSGSNDGVVRLWKAATGECIYVLRGHKGGVRSVALSDDGSRIVSGSDDYAIFVWDAKSGVRLHRLRGHRASVSKVAISPDGSRIVSISDDDKVRVWDAVRGKVVRVLHGHRGKITSLTISFDGGRAAVGSRDGDIRVFDLSSGECVRDLRGCKGRALWVALSADESRMVSVSLSRNVFAAAVNYPHEAISPRNHKNSSGVVAINTDGKRFVLNSIAMNADGSRLVSRSIDGSVYVFDCLSGECIQNLDWRSIYVSSVAMSADGSRVALGCSDGSVILKSATNNNNYRRLKGYVEGVLSAAISKGGRYAVSGSSDGMVYLWSIATGGCIRRFHGHKGRVKSVAISEEGDVVVSSSEDGTARIWSVVDGSCIREIQIHSSASRCIALSSKRRVLATVLHKRSGGAVRVWNMENGEIAFDLPHDRNKITSFVFSENGTRLISGSTDGRVRVWCLNNSSLVSMPKSPGKTLSVASSADGNFVVSGSTDGRVRLWDVKQKRCIHELSGHGNWVWGVALNANGNRAVSCSKDGVVRVWDTVLGECVHKIQIREGLVRCVALSADGRSLLLGSSDGTLRCFSEIAERGELDSLSCSWTAIISSPQNITSHATWRPGRGSESDTLIAASGDAWRLLSWDMEDPREPSGWTRVPLQAYE